MANAQTASIREILLNAIKNHKTDRYGGGSLNQTGILEAIAQTLREQKIACSDEALLTEWYDLFRTGLLAWGMNLSNPNPPWFHLTDRGHQALQQVTRDPNNPAGYLRHLASVATISPITSSYITEGLNCYVDGRFKAAAVMTGAAAESVVLELREAVEMKLKAARKPIPQALTDWKVKTITDALAKVFDGIDRKQHRELRERYEAYWSAFSHQIRTVRNDAGHPASIDPVTPDTIHASLLIFPELARLASELQHWIRDHLA